MKTDASEVDKNFDVGEEVTGFLDLDRSRRPRLESKRVNVDFPGLRFHLLTDDLKTLSAVDVSGNWRIVFRFDENDNAVNVEKH